MNPNEEKLKELKEAEAQIKAEIARANAAIAQSKADEIKAARPTVEEGLQYTRGLQGNRDAEGSLIPAGQHEMPDGTIMADSEMETEPSMSMEDALSGLSVMLKSLGDYDAYKDKGAIGDVADMVGMSREDFVMSPEFQAIYGNKYDKVAKPLGAIKVEKGAEEPVKTYKRMPTDDSDIDKDRRMDSVSADLSAGDTDNPQGRNMPTIRDFEQRSMGMTEDEGGTSSVNEKDDFWKTQEGYDKAMEMYGEKPAWVKEPTMVYDPVANEYVEIEEEDKEQFEDLGISADIKRMFG